MVYPDKFYNSDTCTHIITANGFVGFTNLYVIYDK